MVWLKSLAEFWRGAFQPVRRFNAWIQEAGIPVAGVVVFYVIGRGHGWLWAGFAVASLLVLLFGWDGIRRAHTRLVVDLGFTTDTVAEKLSTGLWKFTIRVQNNGPTGKFVAKCDGAVKGLVANEPRDFHFAWEGKPEEERTIRRRYAEFVDIAYVDAGRGIVRFALPATIYSGADGQSVSPEFTFKGKRVAFTLDVLDVDREGFRRETLTLEMDRDWPKLFIGEPPPEDELEADQE